MFLQYANIAIEILHTDQRPTGADPPTTRTVRPEVVLRPVTLLVWHGPRRRQHRKVAIHIPAERLELEIRRKILCEVEIDAAVHRPELGVFRRVFAKSHFDRAIDGACRSRSRDILHRDAAINDGNREGSVYTPHSHFVPIDGLKSQI